MRYRSICTALLLGLGLLLGAQIQQEGLVLLTDRGHYISGETINYKAFYRRPAESSDAAWSRVLYVELILPNGTPLVQSKVLLDTSTSGSLLIPEGLSSGSYYLKAYTRWMRNCGPENFVYTSLRIYDPYNEQVLPVDTLGWEPRPVETLLNQPEMHGSDMLECLLPKDSYGTREEVVVDLNWNFSHAPANLIISVARSGLQGDQSYFRPGCSEDSQGASDILPETQGLSLTGQAVSFTDRTSAPYATIYVSVLGGDRDFFCNYSDSAGRFYFSFPEYAGERDLFVSAYHSEIDDLELLIDRDFSQDALQLPSYPVRLNDTLTELITEMSVNAQGSQQYYPKQVLIQETQAPEELLFYGKPTSSIKFDDFVNLPTLEEYFVEVVPQVAVRRSGGVRRLIIQGEHPDLSIYPPLLMIDGVAIFDIEAVLAVSPRLIDRVEIVNAPYIRGNVSFGGIISLISKNNDLGYIDLPSSGLLVNYQMLDLSASDTIQYGIQDPRLPDVRNTLYWNPGLELNSATGKRISFRTADLKGEYEILIRGIDSTGKYVEKRTGFSVE
ncbi:MAG: hypothetical protein DRI97_01025 [Bacteroidetes bacterium]|nr:MAG: hypothetical protein DRI97_01025 [Bacteroidota bacterium]